MKSHHYILLFYGETGTGKTYFIRQYLKLYLDPPSGYIDQDQDQNLIIVCINDSDWIDPETGKFYIGFIKCDINIITSKIKSKFKDCVIVLDDMGDTLNNDISYYFTEGRHYNIQMIVMCHKPAQIINTARMSCDTIYLTN